MIIRPEVEWNLAPGQVGCEFGLCPRAAEFEVTMGKVQPVLVCGLHITPVISWGVPEPIAEPTIRPLLGSDGSARRAA